MSTVPYNATHRPLPPSRRALLGVLIAGLCAGPALAQSETGGGRIEEVIVTAQKREENLQETPIAITAFTEAALQKIGVSDITDLDGAVPNVTIRGQGSNSDNAKFGIRGVQTGDTTLLSDPTVGIYVDGVYIARQTGAVFDVVDLERVEVLRGPQGALYGRNTIGGAINLITAQPTGQLGLKQKLTLGNRDYWLSKTTLNTPTLETGAGDFSFMLSYLRSGYGGMLKNNADGRDNLDSRKAEGYRIAAHWAVNDKMSVDYAFDYSDRDSRPESGQLSWVRPNFTAVSGTIYKQAAQEASQHRRGDLTRYFTADADGNSSKIDSHALTLAWDGDAVSFKSITGYREWHATADTIDYGSFLSDGATVLDGKGGLVAAGTPVSLFRANSKDDQRQWSQEFQMVGSAFDDRLDYVVGLYYFEENVKEDNPQTFLLPAIFAYGKLPSGTQSFLCQGSCIGKDTVLSSPIFVYGGTSKSRAIFSQFDYHATDALDLVLGMRYTRDEKDVYLIKGGLNGDRPIDADDSWSKFNPSFTAKYQWTDTFNTYFTVANGYRSGGFNARASTVDSFRTPFNEEQVTSYELGWKSDFLDHRLRVNGALFYLDYDDRQVTQLVAGAGGASSVVVNAGKSTAQGLELEISAALSEGLSMQLSYGYTEIKFKDFVTSLADPVTGFTIAENVDLSSDPRATTFEPVNSPKNMGSLAFDYEFPAQSWGTLSARLAATYSDGYVNNPILNLYDSTEHYTLVDGRISLSRIPLFGDDHQLQVSLWGKNLTNQKVRMVGVDFGSLGFASNSYLELASYGLEFVLEL